MTAGVAGRTRLRRAEGMGGPAGRRAECEFVSVLLVRHAVALARNLWAGDDAARPLNERGRRQADALVEQLAPFAITRFLSSPTVRCVDTVAPAAAVRGLEVAEAEELAEGDGPLAVALVRSLLDEEGDVVLCTHGDVIGEVLTALEKEGARLGGEDRCQKGSTWVLGRDEKRRLQGRYLPPPE